MRQKIKVKLTLFATSIFLVFFSLTSSLAYLYVSEQILTHTETLTRAQLDALNDNLELLLNRIIDEADAIAGDPLLTGLLSGNYGGPARPNAGVVAKIDSMMTDFVSKFNKHIYFVEVVTPFPAPAYRISTGEEYMDRFRAQEFARLLDGKDSGWSVQGHLWPRTPTRMDNAGLLYFKTISGAGSEASLGTLVVHIRPSIWQDVVADIALGIQVLTDDGKVVFTHGRTPEHSSWAGYPSLSEADTGDFTITDRGDRYYASFVRSAATDWNMAGFIRVDDTRIELDGLVQRTAGIGMLCFIVAVLLSLYVSNNLTYPLRQIEISVSKIVKGKGRFQQRILLDQSGWKQLLSREVLVSLLYAILVTLPIVVIVYSLNARAGTVITEQTLTFYNNQLERISNAVELKMETHRQLQNYFFGNMELNRLLAQSGGADAADADADAAGTDAAKPGLQAALAAIAANVSDVNGGGVGMMVLDRREQKVYATGCSDLEQVRRVIEEERSARSNWTVVSEGCGSTYVSTGIRMVALNNYAEASFYDPIGFLFLSFNERSLQYSYSLKQAAGTEVYIVDRNGKTVSHPNKLLLGQTLESVNRSDAKRITRPIPSTDWHAVMEIPTSIADLPMQRMNRLSAGLLCLLFALALGLFYIYFRIVNRRLNQLIAAMNRTAKGNIDTRLNLRTGDEMERLAEGFNVMMSRLSELMEDNYKQGLRRREAEFVALQAQINPHFLYNTLESINWEALITMKGPNKISDMVTALSDLLRYSINRGNEIVAFDQEMNHVKNYIFIQQERYVNKFDVEWDIDRRLPECSTLKLILQPIVENAIYHGFEHRMEKGSIRISGRFEHENAVIEISDNGAGIPPDRLAHIREALDSMSENASLGIGIGIQNVHERIRLFYGMPYGIEIISATGQGTKVLIRLPRHAGKQKGG